MQLGFIAEDVPELVAAENRNNIGPMDIIALLASVAQQHAVKKSALTKSPYATTTRITVYTEPR